MTVETTETTLAITREDLRALFVTTDVSLFTSERFTGLRLYLRRYEDVPIYTATEQRLFPITDSVLGRWRDVATTASAHGYKDDSQAWSWTMNSQYGDQRWPMCYDSLYDPDLRRTLARTIKPGDKLHLSWTADNNSETIRAAGLHVDNVHLFVNNDDPNRSLTFLLGYGVCRDNSARMIQRGMGGK